MMQEQQQHSDIRYTYQDSLNDEYNLKCTKKCDILHRSK